MGTKILGFVCVGVHMLFCAYNTPEKTVYTSNSEIKANTVVETPVAVEDHFYLAMGCDNNMVSGNFLENDHIGEKSSVKVVSVKAPDTGELSYDEQGNFSFETTEDFRGDIQFSYQIQEQAAGYYANANVIITVEGDNDCDGVANSIDIDDDNDGILDFHEGSENSDFDDDGIPNQFDIDSDNDGITDYIEWQNETSLIKYQFADINKDGWDDAFDANLGGNYYKQTDTDQDGSPDFLDLDSDDDGVGDFIEAYDIDNDCLPNCFKRESDLDADGLDDNCDNVYGWERKTNPMGSNNLLPDANNNNIRDWRDITNYPQEGNESEAETLDGALTVYPNPVINICTVVVPETQSNQANRIHIKLYNSTGALLLLKTVSTPVFKLNLNPYNNGQYILKVRNEKGSYFQRIFKVK